MSTAASILSGILFAAALLLFIRNSRKGGMKAERTRPLLQDLHAKEYTAVLLLCIGSLVLHTAAVSGIRLISGRNVCKGT